MECSESTDWFHLLHTLRTQLDSAQSSYNVATFRLEVLSIADAIYFPLSSVPKSVTDSTSTPSSWFKAVCQMQNPSEALDYSLLAFSAIQIRLSGERRISYDQTVQLYNEAISKIITILDIPAVGGSDESLAAIVIVSTCEVSTRVSKSFN